MNTAQARVVLTRWVTASSADLIAAIEFLTADTGGIDAWIASYPDLFVHPRDTVDPASLGVHQTWYTNLMPYRELTVRGRTAYVFEYQLESLCKADA